MAYLTVAEFKIRSPLPGGDVDFLEMAYPGFLSARLEEDSAWIAARLRKRYQVELFASAPPAAVLRWLVALVTFTAWMKRGGNPSGDVSSAHKEAAEAAKTEVTEAAEAEEGLFELPPREGVQGSGIAKGGPLSYSEASPYTWTDEQRSRARGERWE